MTTAGPDASPDLVACYGWCLAVAGYGCRPPGRGFPSAPLDDSQWQGLLEVVRDQRIWGFLHAAVQEGALPCTDGQAEEVRSGTAQATMADMAVEARLVQTSRHLRAAGIEHRMLKGVTTAARVYPRQSLRSYGDVDVLVPGGSFEAAVRRLEESGGKRRFAEARPGFDRRFSKGTSLRMPDGISVDLHRTFVLGPYGFTVDLAGIFSRSDVVTIGGREIQCLEIVDAAVHACIHAALGDFPPRLVPMRDVIQFITDDRIDVDGLLERTREWRGEAVVARALLLAHRAFDLPDSSFTRWALGYRSKRWERRAISLYGEGHTYRRQAIGATRFVPGTRGKLDYIAALSIPAPSYLHEREGTVRRRAIRALGFRPRRAGSAPVRRGPGGPGHPVDSPGGPGSTPGEAAPPLDASDVPQPRHAADAFVTLDGAARWARSSEVLWRRTTAGVALLPPGPDPPLILTGSGALLWDLITGDHDLTRTVAILAERHGVEATVVAADVAPALEELIRRGVLVPAGGAP